MRCAVVEAVAMRSFDPRRERYRIRYANSEGLTKEKIRKKLQGTGNRTIIILTTIINCATLFLLDEVRTTLMTSEASTLIVNEAYVTR
jgi:hypothetical protein